MKPIRLTPKKIDKLLDKLQVMFIDRTITNNEFDMNSFASNSCRIDGGGCKTTHCIGGWMSVLMNLYYEDGTNGSIPWEDAPYNHPNVIISDKNRARLRLLFHPGGYANPPTYTINWYKIKKTHAVRAMQNYRDGMKDPWNDPKHFKDILKPVNKENTNV